MTTFLLTWDGSSTKYEANRYASDVMTTGRGAGVPGSWSIGNRRKGVSRADTVYLLRQRRERGIVARGHVTDSTIFFEPHQDDPERVAAYVRLEWERVLPSQERLDIGTLKARVPGISWDHVFASGQEVLGDSARLLDELWTKHVGRLSPLSERTRVTGDAVYEWLSSRRPGAEHVLDASIMAVRDAFGGSVDYELVGYTEQDPRLERFAVIEVRRSPNDDDAWERMIAAQAGLLERAAGLRRQARIRDPLSVISIVLAGPVESWENLQAEVARSE